MLEAVLRYGLWLTLGACGHLRSKANRTHSYFAHPGELTERMQTRRLNKCYHLHEHTSSLTVRYWPRIRVR